MFPSLTLKRYNNAKDYTIKIPVKFPNKSFIDPYVNEFSVEAKNMSNSFIKQAPQKSYPVNVLNQSNQCTLSYRL